MPASDPPSQIPGRIEPPPPRERRPADPGVMSFGDHLEDLRRRVFLALVGVVPIFAIAFAFGRPLLALLIAPARDALIEGGQTSALLATGPFETFGSVVHIALVVTVLLGSPWMLYQLWKFIAPGLYEHEKRFVHILIPFSGVLVVVSVVFMYLAILPVVLAFFIGFSARIDTPNPGIAPLPEGIVLPQLPVLGFDPPDPEPGSFWVNSDLWQLRIAVPDAEGTRIKSVEIVDGQGIVQQYRISEYIKTLLNLALGFGIAFQTPVVVIMLGWVGVIDPKVLKKYRKHSIAACVLLGAFLTPADPVSMVLMAVPLYLLYELGLLTLRVLPAERIIGRPAREPADAGDA
jgi:sec-independent protein translocase protein TatC